MTTLRLPNHRLSPAAGTMLIFCVAVIGLFYVKWVQGPAAALLMTLAPISLPSLAMTQRVFSLRTLTLTILGVFLAGVCSGLLAVRLEF